MTKSSIGSRSAKKDKGVRFSFEGRNIDTEQMVRGEVVAKNEEEARKKLQRRGIK
ncbi:type II secretion system F family protein, partial [Bacillus stratosphericus]